MYSRTSRIPATPAPNRSVQKPPAKAPAGTSRQNPATANPARTTSDTEAFACAAGHDLKVLYDSLPIDLRHELHCESVEFADKFRDFTEVIKDAVSRFSRSPFAPPDPDIWKRLKDHIDEFPYSSFVNVNDPASVEALGCTPENWFETAIDSIEGITYHRYSPFQGKDEYPTTPIHRGLMLGRFVYEHLFPVPDPNTASRKLRKRPV